MQADLELDCRGLRCPRPIIDLAQHIGDIEIGQVLSVVSDDPAARPDVQAWCRMRSQEYVGEEAGPDGVPAFYIRRLV